MAFSLVPIVPQSIGVNRSDCRVELRNAREDRMLLGSRRIVSQHSRTDMSGELRGRRQYRDRIPSKPGPRIDGTRGSEDRHGE